MLRETLQVGASQKAPSLHTGPEAPEHNPSMPGSNTASQQNITAQKEDERSVRSVVQGDSKTPVTAAVL